MDKKDIMKKLNMYPSQLYRALKDVNSTVEAPKVIVEKPVVKSTPSKPYAKKIDANEFDQMLQSVSCEYGVTYSEGGYGETGDRGHRTDHCGPQGEDWATYEELEALAKPFKKKWLPIIKQIKKAMSKKLPGSRVFLITERRSHFNPI